MEDYDKMSDNELFAPAGITTCCLHGTDFLTDTTTKKLFCSICREEGGTKISCRRCGTLFFIEFGGSAKCTQCGKKHIISPNRFT